MKRSRWIAAWIVLAGICVACGGGSDDDNSVRVFTEDTVLASLTVAPGETVQMMNGASLTVTGETTMNGLIEAIDGQLKLILQGTTTVTGTVRSMHTGNPPPAPNTAFREQTSGICILATGAADLGPTMVETNGPCIVTDDNAQLDRTPQALDDEVEDPAGDSLPTLVPLPPDNPIFPKPGAAPLVAKAAPRSRPRSHLPPFIARGTWAPRGGIYFRLNHARDLVFDNFDNVKPPARNGSADDETANPGQNSNGGNGRNGPRLNIWNNSGSIRFMNTVTIRLADGGNGGDAMAQCATATGGNGGKSGNMRMTASGGIDFSQATAVNIIPGSAGNGGNAIVTKGPPGADGCPGAPGAGATANGGDGGDQRKRLYVRGNVTGLNRVSLGPIVAGNGGRAEATACDGGNGLPCCDGGPGGAATATGGAGGEASLNLGGTVVVQAGALRGGDGGNAIATGGKGGDGGKCVFGMGGAGGAGGDATATSGDGGDATGSGGASGAVGGNPGNCGGVVAEATSGQGGKGGDTVFGTVGPGGLSGSATATSGTGGTGNGPGAANGTASCAELETEPPAGAAGMVIPPIILCIPVAPLVPSGPILNPGPIQNHPVDNDVGTQIGTINLDLPAVAGAQYGAQPAPDHLVVNGGVVAIEIVSLQLQAGGTLPIGGMQILPLDGPNIDGANPMQVVFRDAGGDIMDTQQINNIPDNTAVPTNPVPINIDFAGMPQPVARVEIVVPPLTVVRFLKFTLIDP